MIQVLNDHTKRCEHVRSLDPKLKGWVHITCADQAFVPLGTQATCTRGLIVKYPSKYQPKIMPCDWTFETKVVIVYIPSVENQFLLFVSLL